MLTTVACHDQRDEDVLASLEAPDEALVRLDQVIDSGDPELPEPAANAKPTRPPEPDPLPEPQLDHQARIEIDYEAIGGLRAPRANGGARTAVARCDAHGLHYDPGLTQGCVLCRHPDAALGPSSTGVPSDRTAGNPWIALLLAGLFLSPFAYCGYRKHTAEQPTVADSEAPPLPEQ